MKKFLRSLGLALAFVMLTAGAYAAVSGDSLVSLSYLKSTFFPGAVQAGEEASDKVMEKALDDALAQLDAAVQTPGGGEGTGTFSDTLQRREWSDGQILTLPHRGGGGRHRRDGDPLGGQADLRPPLSGGGEHRRGSDRPLRGGRPGPSGGLYPDAGEEPAHSLLRCEPERLVLHAGGLRL